MIKSKHNSVDQVFGCLHKPGQAAKSVAGMKQAVAQRLRQRTETKSADGTSKKSGFPL
jgi:hypothetical protein